MSFSWSTFALQAINFLALVWLLKRFLFKPVRAIVAQRKAEITRVQAEAETARQRAEQACKQFETRQSEIEAQRQAVIDQTRAEIAAERARMIEDARAEIQKQKSAALKHLDEERDSVAREILGRSMQIAVQLAEQLLRQFAAPRLDELLLGRLLEHLDKLPVNERTALLDQSAADGGQLIVTTACPLDSDAEAKWRAALNQRLGGSQDITFVADKELIAGTELKFPHAVLRFSWRHALADAQRELSQDEHAR
jgi:F-type H+-transporting ATPase subunit b